MKKTLMMLGLLTACGGPSTDPGGGTMTLMVHGRVQYEGGSASLRVTVDRAGNVHDTTATVIVESDLATTGLVHQGGGVYTANTGGWGGYYIVTVTDGQDNVNGTITAPQMPTLTDPSSTTAFDPHTASGGIVTLRWSGDTSNSVRVKTDNFDPGSVADSGQIQVPANVFTKTPTQKVEIDRTNKTFLAGGIGGSDLQASIGTETNLIIVNPY